MSKKILLSILVIVVAIGLVGVGTYALWSDSVTSENNQYVAGTIDVGVSPAAQVPITNMAPLQTRDFTFKVTNNGSVDAGSLVMTHSFTGALAPVLSIVNVTGLGGPLLAGTSQDVVITVQMADCNDNDYMGASGWGSFTFTLNQ